MATRIAVASASQSAWSRRSRAFMASSASAPGIAPWPGSAKSQDSRRLWSWLATSAAGGTGTR